MGPRLSALNYRNARAERPAKPRLGVVAFVGRDQPRLWTEGQRDRRGTRRTTGGGSRQSGRRGNDGRRADDSRPGGNSGRRDGGQPRRHGWLGAAWLIW